MAPSKFQLLYASQLAAGCDFGVVRSIVNVSRQRNRERNITGTLLFDGERFGQLIEGAESDVLELMVRIERHSRHTNIQLLHAGRCAASQSMQRWASGYCDAHELDAFGAESGLRDAAIVDAFRVVLKRADLA